MLADYGMLQYQITKFTALGVQKRQDLRPISKCVWRSEAEPQQKARMLVCRAVAVK